MRLRGETCTFGPSSARAISAVCLDLLTRHALGRVADTLAGHLALCRKCAEGIPLPVRDRCPLCAQGKTTEKPALPVSLPSYFTDPAVGCNTGGEWQWARGMVKQAEVALAQHEASGARRRDHAFAPLRVPLSSVPEGHQGESFPLPIHQEKGCL